MVFTQSQVEQAQSVADRLMNRCTYFYRNSMTGCMTSANNLNKTFNPNSYDVIDIYRNGEYVRTEHR